MLAVVLLALATLAEGVRRHLSRAQTLRTLLRLVELALRHRSLRRD